jgi:GNAT superfamily N-acetyltransferase
MGIRKITFEEVLSFWKQLWCPKNDIQKRSGTLLLFGFDKNIITDDNIEVTYFGVSINNKIVGVNSGFSPRPFEYRSRGLYVLPKYRKQGISQKLLRATEDEGKKKGYIILWSMPRKSALSAYLKFGFKILSEFYDGEFGKNCFVMKVIK